MQSSIPLCLAADENFAWPSLVALSSLHRHARSPLTVRFLDCGLSSASRARLERWAKGRLELRLHRLGEEAWRGLPVPPGTAFSPANYARLSLPELCEEEEVLYLDSDVVALAPIDELWQEARRNPQPLSAARDYFNNFFNACLNADVKTTARNFRALERCGIPDDQPYFNSGVLFLRNRELRRLDWRQRVLALAAQVPALCHLADQTLINVAMRGSIGELSFDWNYQVPQMGVRNGTWGYENVIDRTAHRPRLVHFTSPERPWLGATDASEARFYEEALERLVAETGEAPASGRRN